jgi:hypothetical protein
LKLLEEKEIKNLKTVILKINNYGSK